MANYRFSESETYDAAATLTRRVYEKLRADIVTGLIQPGDRLVRRSLGKRLGVSPMPVTEALYMLELDGLVESRPLCGCRVRPLTMDDLHDDQILREALECQAARLVTEHASAPELGKLATEARTLDRLMSDGDPESKLGMKLHYEFHVRVAVLSGSQRLAYELGRVWSRLLVRVNWIKATRYERVPKDWHQQLVRVLKGRDADQAEAKIRDHVQFGNKDDQAALEEYLKGQEKQST